MGAASLYTALAAGLPGCTPRGLGEPGGEPASPSDDTGGTDSGDDPGQTATSADAPDDEGEDSTGDDGFDDLPADVPPAQPDPCAPHSGDHQDAAQPCGLTHVEFAADDATLDFAAQCQLTAAASCIATQPDTLYLEAHAAQDEGVDEEDAIVLSQARGEAVHAFLVDVGVAAHQMQVIAKGNLRAQGSEDDRSVRLQW